MQFTTGLIAFAAIFLNTAQGHMVMKSPVPYGKSTLTNSPLVADGSDFPCKQRAGVYELEGASNVLEIGAANTLSFTGGATHNGGSCQVSLTTDLAPTKDTKWMVIKSIEGGCPAPNSGGNCGTSADSTCASTFQYTVPEGVAPGKYTIAWSWINHTGNREFYMNCGPADVVAAKKKRYNPNPVVRRQSQFPDLFVANLASINDCKTEEGFDYIYPDGGADVQTAGTGAFQTLACGQAGAGAAQAPTAAGGGAAAASGVATGAASGASSVVTSAPAASGGSGTGASAPAGSPGVFATVPAAGGQAGQSTPVSSAAAAPAATGSTSGSGSSSSSSSNSGAAGSCTAGDWNCLDGKSYQRCNVGGTWSVTMPISAGMSCTPGISSTLSWGPSKAKRVVRKDTGLFDGYQS